ncbi:hypothetical protein PTKIN_Ptkin14bG0051300 [Pterospermum kingtungense]
MEDSSNSIVEERKELMVSPTGKNLKLRNAHFITPSIGLGPVDEKLVANLPSNCLSSSPTTFEPKKWPLEVKFSGWRYPQKNWKTWVVKMASLHESTWKKAGIFEAIMNSTYKIVRNPDLVFGVAEKWCHETQSFVFSWGEATITLEDVMIIGGYSVLGSPVFTSVETEEMKGTWEKLENARKEIYTGKCKKVYQSQWLGKFMYSDSEIEHEAFLALWLSRFVLPSSYDVVAKCVFPIAIHLARGTRIALAPAVLANIYRDLSWLKQNIVASTLLVEPNCDDKHVALAITLWSPLTLVQVWIWERFWDFRPKPNLIDNGEPRLALWHGLKCKVQNVRSVLDSAKERFDWRPYVRKITFWDCPKYYVDNAMWISIDSSVDDELLSFARCLWASELVGLDYIEQYLPHRVALQFGMDQDIPGCVPRSDDSPEIAWSDYNKSADGEKLYIPSRLFEADVPRSMLSLHEQSKDVLVEHKNFTSFQITPKRKKGIKGSDVFTSFKMIPTSLKPQREDDDTCIGFKLMPKKFKGISQGKGFPGSNINPSISKRAKGGTLSSTKPSWLLKLKEKGYSATSDLGSPLKRSRKLAQYPKWKKADRNAVEAKSSIRKDKETLLIHPDFPSKHVDEVTPLFPPGFPPKCNTVGVNHKVSVDERKVNPNTLEVRDFVQDKVIERSVCNHESVGNQSPSSDSHDEDQLRIAEMLNSNQNDNVNCRDAEENSSGHCQSFSTPIADNKLPRCMEKVMPAEAATQGSKEATIQDAFESNAGRPYDKAAGTNHIEAYVNSCQSEISNLCLEARISRLERLSAEMKASRKGKSVVRAWVDLV